MYTYKGSILLYTHLSVVYIGTEAFLARLNERRSYYRLAVTHLFHRQESKVAAITKISPFFNRPGSFPELPWNLLETMIYSTTCFHHILSE